MPPSLQPGRCLTYEESPGKRVYAVVVEMGTDHVLVARGTSNASHEEAQRIRVNPVQPRSREARGWVNPPVTRDTYFYTFDIQLIERAVIDAADLHRLCEESLWDDIRNAAQRRAVPLAMLETKNRLLMSERRDHRSTMELDPMLLTFESLAAHLRSVGGPAWQAAIDHGIDVTLLERNLALSPTDRMRQHDEALRLYFELRR